MADHLTLADREVIQNMLAKGQNYSSIAQVIGKSSQTISKEVQRGRQTITKADGSVKRIYNALHAQEKYLEKKQSRTQHKRNFSERLQERFYELLENVPDWQLDYKSVYESLRQEFDGLEAYPSEATVRRWIDSEKELRLKADTEAAELIKVGHSAYIRDDLKNAYKAFEEGAMLGNHYCQMMLSYFYYVGLYIEQDFALALDLMRRAATGKFGLPEAQWRLGYFYDNGLPGALAADLNAAFYWYLQAARHQDVNGMVYLAFYYEHGSAMTRSIREAARWYHIAAEQGNAYAKNWIEQHEQEVLIALSQTANDRIRTLNDAAPYSREQFTELFKLFTLGRTPTMQDIQRAIDSGEIKQK